VLDLDDFKVVNDRYGHAAGDAALRAVGAELRAALRGGDVAARLGGDEFALLVVGVENVASLSPLLGRLKRALERAVRRRQWVSRSGSPASHPIPTTPTL